MTDEQIARLERLAALRDQGALTDLEYEKAKSDLLHAPVATTDRSILQRGERGAKKGPSKATIAIVYAILFVVAGLITVWAVNLNSSPLADETEAGMIEAETEQGPVQATSDASDAASGTETSDPAKIMGVCNQLRSWSEMAASSLILSTGDGMLPATAVHEIARRGGMSMRGTEEGGRCIANVRISGTYSGHSFNESGQCQVTSLVTGGGRWAVLTCQN